MAVLQEYNVRQLVPGEGWTAINSSIGETSQAYVPMNNDATAKARTEKSCGLERNKFNRPIDTIRPLKVQGNCRSLSRYLQGSKEDSKEDISGHDGLSRKRHHPLLRTFQQIRL